MWIVYKHTLCFKVIAVRSNFACLHNFDIQMQIVMLMAFDEYHYCFVHVVLKHDEKFSVCPQNSFVTVSRITKVTQTGKSILHKIHIHDTFFNQIKIWHANLCKATTVKVHWATTKQCVVRPIWRLSSRCYVSIGMGGGGGCQGAFDIFDLWYQTKCTITTLARKTQQGNMENDSLIIHLIRVYISSAV